MLNFQYLVDFERVTPFHLDIYVDKKQFVANDVTLTDYI